MNEQILVALCSLLFGILPDFDILLLSMFNIPRFLHHDIVTHTPILYIGIWVLLRILIKVAKNILNKKTGKVLDERLLNILANTFLIGTLSHLLADFLVNSIMLLYPFTNFKFFLLEFLFEPNLFAGILFSVMAAIEMLFLTVFLYVVYQKFLKRNRVAEKFLQLFIFLSVIYIPFSIYISLNTYNSVYMYDEKRDICFDIDYDGISDKLDMDIGNTGESNIEKADGTDVLNGVLNIVNSGKWTKNHDITLIAKIKRRYGGLDSYRLIEQTYYDIHLPIGPVLKDYFIKTEGFQSYWYNDYDSSTLLLEYLKEREDLIELNLDAAINLAPGKIFFIMRNGEEEGMEIENLGITLEGNYLAIVLDCDTKLKMHSYSYIREFYKDNIGTILIQK